MSHSKKFEVRNRWNNRVQFTAEITCSPDASIALKLGLAVRWARSNGADLRDADLRDADLSGAVLSGADLSDADWLPRISNIHQSIYNAASAEGALDMSTWHRSGYCGTTHCRAGWAVVLAGEGGRVLEGVYGTGTAAALIYQASDPTLERVPDWIASNSDALADMRRLAEAEAASA